MTPRNRIILGGRGRSSETESDRSLFESVRDYRFELLRIRIWVYLYDPEIVDVGLTSSLLFLFSLGFVHFCIAFVASNIFDKMRFLLYLSKCIRYVCSNNVCPSYPIPTTE